MCEHPRPSEEGTTYRLGLRVWGLWLRVSGFGFRRPSEIHFSCLPRLERPSRRRASTHLQGKARIWPRLSDARHIRSTADCRKHSPKKIPSSARGIEQRGSVEGFSRWVQQRGAGTSTQCGCTNPSSPTPTPAAPQHQPLTPTSTRP